MNIKNITEKIKEKLPVSKSKFLIVLGIVGLLLIMISSFDFVDTGQKETDDDPVSSKVFQTSDNISETESKLQRVISYMLGGTKVTVMVTLESGAEYVFADEIKTDADVTKDQSALKTQQSDSNHKTYIVIKDSEGNEHPLIVTEKMPIVRGVVVVCKNGETPSVASAVRLAVRSSLNVDDEKICIIGRH